ncbi:hypothetical protein L9W92_10555 [Pelotomaculum terephthalicicum JT]|uniref:hypothetical protein n=1 Tax=Pelotomaculum TaxID=191373 RepID=UPI0009D2E8D8|nr:MULTISPECIES: hypothetical protein [Pelotomaculum]MCG9968492.1 hypothetical protein [Pelotomaculum terephthalicicum JT]OPX88916.1 MAG: hypothetical protein A4E54_01178 [Pelotomaculum sp. PtaB.Bin117]
MKKIQIGDVFEIATSKGKGYFQYIYSNKTIGELIRILPGLYLDKPRNMIAIAAAKEVYFVHFPLKAAFKKGIVQFIGNYSLPQDLELPRQMRSKNVDKNGNLICWYIVEYDTWRRVIIKELTKDQKKLSPWGIWNDTLLIERLAEGWTPEEWT